MAASAGKPALLITRPRAQAAALSDMLKRSGFNPVSIPLIEIEPLAEVSDQQKRLIYELDGIDRVIFVSTNAVRLGMAVIADIWPQLPIAPAWYGIGAATERALTEYGVVVRKHEARTAMNSEELLAHPDFINLAGQRILLVRGCGGRTVLADTLRDRGAQLSHLEVYKRSIPRLSGAPLAATIAEASIELILLSSGEALNNMEHLVPEADWGAICEIPVLVAGERNAEAARTRGFHRVVQAANPTDEAMVSAALEWHSTRSTPTDSNA